MTKDEERRIAEHRIIRLQGQIADIIGEEGLEYYTELNAHICLYMEGNKSKPVSQIIACLTRILDDVSNKKEE
jgi:hypothetical protein